MFDALDRRAIHDDALQSIPSSSSSITWTLDQPTRSNPYGFSSLPTFCVTDIKAAPASKAVAGSAGALSRMLLQ